MQGEETTDMNFLTAQLQKQVDREMEKIYSKKTINYSKNPVNIGRMKDADSSATLTGGCGDTIEMYLRIKGSIIKKIQFFSDGCGVTIACGSALTAFVKGMTINDILKISPYQLIDELGGLPKDDVHCAILSVCTLHLAIANYLLKTQ